jgi:uncharacterized membrane protein YkvA (DUF1232 family)
VITDFNPILGYVDDAIVVVLVLRSVCRRVSVKNFARGFGQGATTASPLSAN